MPSASPPSAPPPQGSPYAPIPSHVQDHPSQPYSPFRAPDAAATAAPPPATKSRKGLVIGLAIGGVALVGGIVAFAVTREDKPSRSRDAVIKQTFAALAAGDDKALFALADPVNTFKKIARCEKRSSSDDKADDLLGSESKRTAKLDDELRDPDKLGERWTKDVKQLLRRTKGTKIEVVDILTELPPPMGTKPKKKDLDDDDRSERDRDRDRDRDWDRERYREDDEDRPERDNEYKTKTYKKGHELAKGCYARQPFRDQLVKVVVEVKEGDREFTQRVKLNMHEIDGVWYLGNPPSLNVGFDVVVADLEAWKDKACKCTDAACVEDLDEENGRLAYAQYMFDRDADLPKETILKMEKLQTERKVCEGTAQGGPELARYKELKDQLCACKEEECGKKLELEMIDLRRKVENNLRRARLSSYEVTRQVSDLALAASDCTRKLALTRVTLYSGWPAQGEITGGTPISIRGTNLMSVPRTVKVFFGTKESPMAKITGNNEIVVETPPQDAAGFVEVKVELVPGGTITVPYGFTYVEAKKPIKKPANPKIKPPVDEL